MTFDLEDDEALALMQCAAAGAQAAQVLLGGNARPMRPIFEKIQAQFSEQQRVPRTNGKAAADAVAAG
jgi:hypothetical protein